ncbi:MAG: NAD(P)-dependent oxidoreductase [Pyrinomonadaceae bacterium]|nr:NAD(P)-dependent oxidoreductase [Pyrinomonadaceae bacterium]
MTETRENAAQTGKGTILFGGSGFLGPYILENYPDVISVGRTAPSTANRHIQVDNLANLDALRDVAFDKVIFIIGNTDHYNLEKEHVPAGEPTAFDYHVTPLIQTLEQLKSRPIKKFINFSTILVYDDKKITLPISEHSPITPYRNRYVLSKYLGEEACKFYAKWMPIITVRLSNIYGPTPLKRFDLIHLLVHQLLDQGKGQVWSTKPERDFIYVNDAAHAIVKLLDTDYTGLLNLGTGTMTSVRQIVDLLQELSGCPITDLNKPTEGPMKFRCDMTTLEKLIDWKPRYSTEEGVGRTYELMKSWREKSYEAGN